MAATGEAIGPEEQARNDGLSSKIPDITESLRLLQLEFPSAQRDHDTLCTVSKISFGAIKKWLADCESSPGHHGCIAAPTTWASLPGTHFRLIDTEKRYITC